jgi:hypothetical protein
VYDQTKIPSYAPPSPTLKQDLPAWPAIKAAATKGELFLRVLKGFTLAVPVPRPPIVAHFSAEAPSSAAPLQAAAPLQLLPPPPPPANHSGLFAPQMQTAYRLGSHPSYLPVARPNTEAHTRGVAPSSAASPQTAASLQLQRPYVIQTGLLTATVPLPTLEAHMTRVAAPSSGATPPPLQSGLLGLPQASVSVTPSPFGLMGTQVCAVAADAAVGEDLAASPRSAPLVPVQPPAVTHQRHHQQQRVVERKRPRVDRVASVTSLVDCWFVMNPTCLDTTLARLFDSFNTRTHSQDEDVTVTEDEFREATARLVAQGHVTRVGMGEDATYSMPVPVPSRKAKARR